MKFNDEQDDEVAEAVNNDDDANAEALAADEVLDRQTTRDADDVARLIKFVTDV